MSGGGGVYDWTEKGIWPLQDHEEGVPIEIRQAMMGMRVVKLPDPAKGEASTFLEFGREGIQGTIGDVHPWWFWQTRDIDTRPMGSWAQAFAAVITGTSGGFSNGPTGTGTAPSVQFLPVRNSGFAPDGRYVEKSAPVPPGAPTPPIGSICIALPGTEEASQQELLICAAGPDGGGAPLIAPTKRGPPEMGTLVWDLQPEGTLCKDGSPIPGIGGRHARLQSAFRVIPMDQGQAIGAGAGNSIAINYALSTQDQLAGYGMAWIRLAGGGGTQAVKPSAPPGGPIGPAPGPGGGGASGILRDLVHPLPPPGPGVPIGPGVPPGAVGGKGQFKPEKVGGHGIAYMAHLGAFGPFHGGSENDIHQIGFTRDGEPCNSGHLSTDAYFYADQGHDGPLFFEQQDYPEPPPQPITTKVHLVWDGTLSHPWLRGTKAGRWRWYAETSAICPESETPNIPQITTPTTGVGTPKTPTTPNDPTPNIPTTGQPGGPITPGGSNQPTRPTTPGGGGPGRPITPGGSTQPSNPTNPPGPGGRIWTGGPSLRPGGRGMSIPGTQGPSINRRPKTPGGHPQPTQGVPWEHLTGHTRPLPPIHPDPRYGGTVQQSQPITGIRPRQSTAPSLGRTANFGQSTVGSVPTGGEAGGEFTNDPQPNL